MSDVSGETNDGFRKAFENVSGVCGFSKGEIAHAWQAQAASCPDVSHFLPNISFSGVEKSAGGLPNVSASSFSKGGMVETPKLDGLAGAKPNAIAGAKPGGIELAKLDATPINRAPGFAGAKPEAMAMVKGNGGMPKFDALGGKLENFAPPKMDGLNGLAGGDLGGVHDPTGISAMFGHFLKLLEGMAVFPSAEQLLDPHIAGEVAEEFAKAKGAG